MEEQKVEEVKDEENEDIITSDTGYPYVYAKKN